MILRCGRLLLLALAMGMPATFPSPLQAKVDGYAECRYYDGKRASLGISDPEVHKVAYMSGRELDELFGNWEILKYGDSLYVVIWLENEILLVKTGQHAGRAVNSIPQTESPICGDGLEFETGRKTAYKWEITPADTLR